MQNDYNTNGKHLTYSERILIERWKNKENKSNRTIAKLLGKAPQTINNEIKRGAVDLTFHGEGISYSADIAQNNYDHNRSAVGRTDIWSPEKEAIIQAKIKEKYSPEVISQDNDMPCFNTIYAWIYKGWIKGISQKDMLYPRKPHKIKQTKPKSIRKKSGLSIEQRPESINQREEVGHFEIDLVILNHKKGQQLLTLTDRRTRFEIIRLISDKTTKSVNNEMKKLNEIYSFKSITADNGSEFQQLDQVIRCPIYYCHPYSSYERGSNENNNRLIRRWLPKGTKITTAKAVAKIEHWMNHYPRKIFNFKCPKDLPEVANLLL